MVGPRQKKGGGGGTSLCGPSGPAKLSAQLHAASGPVLLPAALDLCIDQNSFPAPGPPGISTRATRPNSMYAQRFKFSSQANVTHDPVNASAGLTRIDRDQIQGSRELDGDPWPSPRTALCFISCPFSAHYSMRNANSWWIITTVMAELLYIKASIIKLDHHLIIKNLIKDRSI